MTVCLAALCTVEEDGKQYPAVVIASDRLLTHARAGTEHDAPQHKHFPLRERVLALLSDDVGECYRVCRAAHSDLQAKASELVEVAAERVGENAVILMERRFQREWLDPFQTNLAALTGGTTDFEPSFSRDLLDKYRGYSLPCDIIVTGVDETGAHVWYVDGRGVTYLADGESFAAVGSGADIAGETLRRLGYHHDWSINRALFAVALAKRHAEAAIGVGNRSTSIASICVNGVRYAYEDIDAALARHMDDYDKACARAFSVGTEATIQVADELVNANKLWVMQQVSEGMEKWVRRQTRRRGPTRNR